MDDLFKALGMFKEGMTQYQTAQAVNDARDSLTQLQKSEDDKSKLFQGTAQIGQDLALRLTGAGASPEKIQSAIGGMVPSASMESQNQATMAGQKMGFEKAMEVEKLKAASAEKIAGIHADALNGKNQGKDFSDAAKAFEKLPQVIPALKSLPTLQDASDKMHENFGQYGSTAITNLVKMGVIKASVARVTEKEIEAANESPSMWAKFQKERGLQLTGETPKNVQEFWTKVVDDQLNNTKQHLQKHIKSYSGSNPKLDASLLEKSLLSRHNLSDTSSAADIQQALEWLSSDEGAKADPGMRKAIADKIKKMQQGQ